MSAQKYQIIRDILANRLPHNIQAKHPRWKIRAGALIIDTRTMNILIVRERVRAGFPGNVLSIPKGVFSAYRDESYLDTALFELYEETGIHLSREDTVCPTAEILINPGCLEVTIIFVIEIARDIVINPHDSEEIESCNWMSIDDISRDNGHLPIFMRALILQIKSHDTTASSTEVTACVR